MKIFYRIYAIALLVALCSCGGDYKTSATINKPYNAVLDSRVYAIEVPASEFADSEKVSCFISVES